MRYAIVVLVVLFQFIGVVVCWSMVHADDITLSWECNTEYDISHYEIHKARVFEASSGVTTGPFSLVHKTGVSTEPCEWTEKDVLPKTQYAYVVYAVDTEGKRSAISNLAMTEEKPPEPVFIKNLIRIEIH